ncbi:recombinase family protein [Myxococcota bacterium]|nr:recombinase family protein [Myxococcota bacterium]
MKYIGYVRTSNEGNDPPPAAQKRELEDWCSNRNAELVRLEYDRGLSSTTPADERPGLLRAIAAVGHGRDANVLLTLGYDLLGSSLLQACTIQAIIERQGGKLQYVSSLREKQFHDEELVQRLLSAFFEYERTLVRLREKAAMSRGRTERQWIGECPYGFRIASDGGHLEPDEQEQAIIRRIWASRDAGLSIRAIAAQLNVQGVPARGKLWHYPMVQRIAQKNPSLAKDPDSGLDLEGDL